MISFSVPLIGLAAYSGTGKTTLLCEIIPLLTKRGFRVGIVKHAHHSFDIDHPKKDSCKLRESGARKMVVSSKKRTAIIIEHPDDEEEPTLVDALKFIHTKDLDLILVEGFKKASVPKIELHREELDRPYLYHDDENIIAIATDHELKLSKTLHKLDLNNHEQIAAFIESFLLLENKSHKKNG